MKVERNVFTRSVFTRSVFTRNIFTLFLYLFLVMQLSSAALVQAAAGNRFRNVFQKAPGMAGRARPRQPLGTSHQTGFLGRLAENALNEPYDISFVERPASRIEGEGLDSRQEFKEMRDEVLRQDRSEKNATAGFAQAGEQSSEASSSSAASEVTPEDRAQNIFAKKAELVEAKETIQQGNGLFGWFKNLVTESPAQRVQRLENELAELEQEAGPEVVQQVAERETYIAELPIQLEQELQGLVNETKSRMQDTAEELADRPRDEQLEALQHETEAFGERFSELYNRYKEEDPITKDVLTDVWENINGAEQVNQLSAVAEGRGPVTALESPVQQTQQPVVQQPVAQQFVAPQRVALPTVPLRPQLSLPAPILQRPLPTPPATVSQNIISPAAQPVQPTVQQPIVQALVPQPRVTQRPSPYVSAAHLTERDLPAFIPRQTRRRIQQQVYKELEAAGVPRGEARSVQRAERYQAIGRQLVQDLQREGTPFALPSPAFIQQQAARMQRAPQQNAPVSARISRPATMQPQGALVRATAAQPQQRSQTAVGLSRRPVDQRVLARVQAGDIEPAFVVQYKPVPTAQHGILQPGELIIRARNREGLFNTLTVDLNMADTAQWPPQLQAVIEQLVAAQEPATLGLYRPEEARLPEAQLLDFDAAAQGSRALMPANVGVQPEPIDIIDRLVQVLSDERTVGLVAHVPRDEAIMLPAESQHITHALEQVPQPVSPRSVVQQPVVQQPAAAQPSVIQPISQQPIIAQPTQQPEQRREVTPVVPDVSARQTVPNIPVVQSGIVEPIREQAPQETSGSAEISVPSPAEAEDQAALAAELARRELLDEMRREREAIENERRRAQARARQEARECAERAAAHPLRRHRDAILAALHANRPIEQIIVDDVHAHSIYIADMLRAYNNQLRHLVQICGWHNEQKDEAVRVRNNMKIIIRRALNI